MNKIRTRFALLLLVASVTACVANDPNQRLKVGVAIGAIAGAVIGHQLDDGSGRYVGAAVGALAGGAVGRYMDAQQAELKAALGNELEANAIRVTRVSDERLKLELSSEATFSVNSSSVQPAFRQSLSRIADVVRRFDKTAVHVIGHTDSSGPTAFNQTLSESRADAVAIDLVNNGVTGTRVEARGLGESSPVSSNSTVQGRDQNRRVEIYLNTIVEGRENDAFQSPA